MNDVSQSLDGRPEPDEIGSRQGFQSALAALFASHESSRHVPANFRFVNRPMGRIIAVVASVPTALPMAVAVSFRSGVRRRRGG